MGISSPGHSPLQDVPPPQDKGAGSIAQESHPKEKVAATNWQQLFSSTELKATLHDVFTEDGRERVCASCLSVQYN